LTENLGCFTDWQKNLRGVVPVRGTVWLRTASLEQRSSTFAHGAPWGAPKYAWGAPLRKGSQGCITNLSH